MNWGKFGFLGNPFPLDTGPTALVAPAYPTLLGFLFRVTGSETSAMLAARWVTAAIVASLAGAMPVVAHRLGVRPAAGIFAGLALVPPVFASIETSGQWDTPFVAAALAGCIAMAMPTLRMGTFSAGVGARHGVAWGMAFLVAPTIASVYVALSGLAIVRWRSRLGRVARYVMASVLTSALVIAPYLLRIRRDLGGFTFVRSNVGLELWVSNNDRARVTMRENLDPGGGMSSHPRENDDEARRLAELGELTYTHDRLLEAQGWIREYPLRFARLSAARAVEFWAPTTGRWYHTVLGAGVALGALLSLLALARENRYLAALLAAPLLSFAMIYAFVQADLRHGYPLIWLELLLSAALVVRLSRAWLLSLL
jgi:hypothetical protein